MIPTYIHLLHFHGIVRHDHILCANILRYMLPYKDHIVHDSDFITMFLHFVAVMDSDNDVLQRHIIYILHEIILRFHNMMIDSVTNTRAIVLAAKYGHYSTVSCLLTTCDDISYTELFDHIYEFEESIIMLILRSIENRLRERMIILDLTTLIGKCIVFNNKVALNVLHTWFPVKYNILTGCNDCQKVIEDINEDACITKLTYVPSPFILNTSNMTVYDVSRRLIEHMGYEVKSRYDTLYIDFDTLDILYNTTHYWWEYITNSIIRLYTKK